MTNSNLSGKPGLVQIAQAALYAPRTLAYL